MIGPVHGCQTFISSFLLLIILWIRPAQHNKDKRSGPDYQRINLKEKELISGVAYGPVCWSMNKYLLFLCVRSWISINWPKANAPHNVLEEKCESAGRRRCAHSRILFTLCGDTDKSLRCSRAAAGWLHAVVRYLLWSEMDVPTVATWSHVHCSASILWVHKLLSY